MQKTALVPVVLVLAGAAAGGAYYLGAATSGETSTSTAAPPVHTPGAVAPPPTPQQGASDAEAAALAWLSASNHRSWRDPAPDAWIENARPYMTGEVLEQATAARGRPGGRAWNDLRQRRCEQTVTEPGSVIPPEAPRTDDRVWVQVTGELVTTCADQQQAQAPQPLAATVELTRGLDGTWQVRRRLY